MHRIKLFSLALLGYVGLMTSCTTTDMQLFEDKGCIERLEVPVTAHNIASDSIHIVNQLFANNNMPTTHYRYLSYERNPFQTLYSPYTQYDEQLVRVLQYTNSLPIFHSDLVFDFWNGSLHYQGGKLTNGTSINNSPTLTLGQIRALFLSDIQTYNKNAILYKDSCFKAELGYYNVNAGTNNATEKLVRAWHVTPKNRDYPEAFYDDERGRLLYYFDGIYTF